MLMATNFKFCLSIPIIASSSKTEITKPVSNLQSKSKLNDLSRGEVITVTICCPCHFNSVLLNPFGCISAQVEVAQLTCHSLQLDHLFTTYHVFSHIRCCCAALAWLGCEPPKDAAAPIHSSVFLAAACDSNITLWLPYSSLSPCHNLHTNDDLC